jgi:hypothetical protein
LLQFQVIIIVNLQLFFSSPKVEYRELGTSIYMFEKEKIEVTGKESSGPPGAERSPFLFRCLKVSFQEVEGKNMGNGKEYR